MCYHCFQQCVYTTDGVLPIIVITTAFFTPTKYYIHTWLHISYKFPSHYIIIINK